MNLSILSGILATESTPAVLLRYAKRAAGAAQGFADFLATEVTEHTENLNFSPSTVRQCSPQAALRGYRKKNRTQKVYWADILVSIDIRGKVNADENQAEFGGGDFGSDCLIVRYTV